MAALTFFLSATHIHSEYHTSGRARERDEASKYKVQLCCCVFRQLEWKMQNSREKIILRVFFLYGWAASSVRMVFSAFLIPSKKNYNVKNCIISLQQQQPSTSIITKQPKKRRKRYSTLVFFTLFIHFCVFIWCEWEKNAECFHPSHFASLLAILAPHDIIWGFSIVKDEQRRKERVIHALLHRAPVYRQRKSFYTKKKEKNVSQPFSHELAPAPKVWSLHWLLEKIFS